MSRATPTAEPHRPDDTGPPAGVPERLQPLLDRVDRLVPRPETFPATRGRSERTTSLLGISLAVTFSICFLTGLVSHFLQNPVGPSWWRGEPVWFYRVSQAVHVTTGVASIPLLGTKLWSVAPKFWKRPLLGGFWDGLERLSLLVLIGSAAFLLLTGLLNTAEYYWWFFFFPWMHYAMSWVAVGSLVLHIGLKLPVVRRALRRPPTGRSGADAPGFSRRGVLGLAGAGALLGVLTTAGDKWHVLSPVSIFSQRSGRGPQGLPVNGLPGPQVVEGAEDPAWALTLTGPDGERQLSLAQLQALPQHEADLPIACVEGWSFTARWGGVPLRDLLTLASGTGMSARMFSLGGGNYGVSWVSSIIADHPDTLIALRLNGEPLALDHGFPARLVAPNRPGAMQTKWLQRIELEPA